MVRLWLGFILCGSWERTSHRPGGSSLLPVERGGGEVGEAAILLGIIFKILVGFRGYFHIRERYRCSHFNKFNDSNAKQEQV